MNVPVEPARSEHSSIDPESDAEFAILASQLRTKVLDPIKGRLIGKDEIVEVLGVALTAGENTFLLGPPGTAKSALSTNWPRGCRVPHSTIC